MIITKGKISKLWINNLDDGRTYATLQIGDDRYTLWDKKYIKKLKEGDTIDYDYKQSGKYKNIKTILNVSAGKPQDNDSKPAEGNGRFKINPEYKKDREIVRMSCLKSALYATRDLYDLDIPDRTELILGFAKKFEKYVTDFDDDLDDLRKDEDGNGKDD